MQSVCAIVLLSLSASAAATEVCAVDPGGQFGKFTMCVSSVLGSQGGNMDEGE